MTASCRASIRQNVWRAKVTGTIMRLDQGRGVGTLLGGDGKHYIFRRRDVRDIWFHDLTEGATVAFDPDKNLSATRVQLVTRSV